MCGIGGIVSFNPQRPVRRVSLEAMAGSLAHRGPDAQGIWSGRQAGFAFRRLAVLDPTDRAMQPMTSADGRYTLVFNGEIYNFRELKAHLPSRNWHTRGDTEVLLAALIEWGAGALPRLSGMFAIALWDDRDKTLLLARDAMGQKPLYFGPCAGGIAFASELPALHACDGWDRTIDDAAVGEYLRFGYINAPRTIYRGARQLEPGRVLLVTEAALNTDDFSSGFDGTEWFDCNAVEDADNSAPTRDAAARDAKSLIESAVGEQLVSDVPLGVFLSGGIDSSVIALCARKRGAAQTFSIGFDDPRYDETPYAREVAKHLGTQHHEFRVTPDAASELPKLATLFGEPFGDSSALPTSALARETRKHVTVALSGDGGDELYGGYDRYRAMAMNLTALRPLKPLGPMLAGAHPKGRVSRLGRLIRTAGLGEGERYRQIIGLFDEAQVRSLLPTALGDHEYLEGWDALRQTRSATETALAIDRLTYLPGDLLAKVDRCSMRFALEVRSPFMDARVVRMAAGLKNADLLKGGKKRLLREAFAGELPASVFGRPKMGFAVPIGEWFRGILRPMLRDNLLRENGFCREHFRIEFVQKLIAEHESKSADHTQRLYALLMLELWWQTRAG